MRPPFLYEVNEMKDLLKLLDLSREEIVRILDRIFAKEQQAREAAENVLQRIDQMKKAILARAFRGELD